MYVAVRKRRRSRRKLRKREKLRKEIRFIEPEFRRDYCSEYYGGRTFSVAAPRVWNKLPNSIRTKPTIESFKSALKTHLFRQHFY